MMRKLLNTMSADDIEKMMEKVREGWMQRQIFW